VNRISIFVVDLVPQGLELFLVEVFIEPVVLNIGLIPVLEHLADGILGCLIVQGADQHLNTFSHRREFPGHGGKRIVSQIGFVLFGNLILVVNIVVFPQIAPNGSCLLFGDCMLFTITQNKHSRKVCNIGFCRTIPQYLLGLTLQGIDKTAVTLIGNDRQSVQIVYVLAQGFKVHSNAVPVHTQTQSSAYLLTLGHGGIGVTQRADLENIRVVPTFPQGRVREDKPRGLIETQQTLLVL